tara:strand:- start:214 stop:381 length:168 start_codon:yes stop_codon:yes gene_type:complete
VSTLLLIASIANFTGHRSNQSQLTIELPEDQNTAIAGDVSAFNIGSDLAPFTAWK